MRNLNPHLAEPNWVFLISKVDIVDVEASEVLRFTDLLNDLIVAIMEPRCTVACSPKTVPVSIREYPIK